LNDITGEKGDRNLILEVALGEVRFGAVADDADEGLLVGAEALDGLVERVDVVVDIRQLETTI
jgi:hypothetical protein